LSLRRRAVSVAAASAVHSLLAVAASVVLARMLGPEGRGTYAIATLLAMLAGQLGTLGFDTGGTVAIGREPASARRVAGASLLIAGVCGLPLAAALAGAALGWGGVLFPSVPVSLAVLSAAAVPFLILSALLNGVLAGLGRVAQASWTYASGALAFVALLGAAWLASGPRLGAAVGAFVVSSVATAAALAWTTLRRTGLQLSAVRSTTSSMAGISLTSHAAHVLHLLHLRLDVFLVNAMLGPLAAGLYSLAQAVCEWAWLLPRAAASTLLPAVAGASAGSGIAETARTSRVVGLASGVTVLGLAAVAGVLIPSVFGEAFAGSVAAVRILAPGIWLGSSAGVLSAFLTGRGRPQFPLLNSLLSLALNVALNLALIPRYGIAGAAAASALTYTFCTAVNVWFVRRMADVSVRELFVVAPAELRAMLRIRPARTAGPGAAAGAP
jgi:O-antigen/teichoic acid export membrane protein